MSAFAVCSRCDWSQLARSMADSDHLLREHHYDRHGGPNTWTTAWASPWVPPVYRPDAKDLVLAGDRGEA